MDPERQPRLSRRGPRSWRPTSWLWASARCSGRTRRRRPWCVSAA